ncbi:hypothetical protein AKJ16_DCAP08191 [Drosera capensis]
MRETRAITVERHHENKARQSMGEVQELWAFDPFESAAGCRPEHHGFVLFLFQIAVELISIFQLLSSYDFLR